MTSDYYILQLERNNVYLRARFLQLGDKKKWAHYKRLWLEK